MNDMAVTIIPRSDQMNAETLLIGPITITISGVEIRPGTEQPVSIHYAGDDGKPWKPCKSMCRLLVAAWGADAKAYVGRSVTLYRDPSVKWAGMEVGGIRISHLSNLEATMTMALTATRGSKKLHTVRPMPQTAPAAPAAPYAAHLQAIKAAANMDILKVAFNAGWGAAKAANDEAAKVTLKAAYDERKATIEGVAQ